MLMEGRQQEAIELLLEEAGLLNGRSLVDMSIIVFASMVAEAAMVRGNLDLASLLFDQLSRLPPERSNLPAIARARAQMLELRQQRGEALEQGDIETVMDALGQALAEDNFPVGATGPRHNLALSLAQLLTKLGQTSDAEDILREFDSPSPAAWMLRQHLAVLIAHRPHAPEELSDAILNVIISIDQLALETDPEGDPLHLLSTHDDQLEQLVDIAVWSFGHGRISDELMRAVADLQASPVSSRRIGLTARGQAPTSEVTTDHGMAELLRGEDSAVLQFIDLGEDAGMAVLISRLADSELRCDVRRLPIRRTEASRLAKRLRFRINRLSTTTAELNLDEIPDWDDFAAALRNVATELFPDVPMLQVVPGPIDTTLVSLAFDERYTLAFLPSLAAGVALDRLRREREWHPSRIADFAVWRIGDAAETVKAICNGVEAMETLCEVQQPPIDFIGRVGRDATLEALKDCLVATDLVRLSAHGIVSPGSGRFELLIAADGSLPPSAAQSVKSEVADRYRLHWNVLDGLGTIAPVVISNSCESGLALTVAGGERLGLERVMFRSGVWALVAPQWEAPIEAMQAITVDVMRRLIETPRRSLRR